MATLPAPLDVRLIPPHLAAAREDPSCARGWAEATLRWLGPPATEPDRRLICRALTAAGPAIGDRATVRWGTGRDRHTWTGVVVGRSASGFTLHTGRYRRFVGVIDLWARPALLDEPGAARTVRARGPGRRPARRGRTPAYADPAGAWRCPLGSAPP